VLLIVQNLRREPVKGNYVSYFLVFAVDVRVNYLIFGDEKVLNFLLIKNSTKLELPKTLSKLKRTSYSK